MALSEKPKNQNKYGLLKVLVGVLLVYLIIFFAFVIRNESKKYSAIGKAPAERRTITIDGTGKVVGAPDIANVDIGFTTQSADVQTALKQNNEKTNQLVSELKKAGVAAADIQTSRFNVYPNYDYTKSKPVIVSYTADQGVSVKIRDLNKTSAVLQVAGDVGANQVSGLSFTIDNRDTLQAAAREKAIKNAGDKADVLAKQLGITFKKIVNFSESSGNYNYPVYAYDTAGMGGSANKAVTPPTVETGSMDIVSNVALTYEIE